MMTFQRNSNEISGDQIYQIIENRGELLYHIPYIKELEISKTTERKNLWDENSIEAFFRNNLVIQVKTKILEKLGNAIGIFLRKDLNLGKGKSGAQLSHGAISLLYQPTFKTGALDHYLADNDKKILLFTIKDLKNLLEIQDLCRKNNVNYSLIQDAGHTQIEAGTATCIAIGPIPIIWIQILAFNLEAKELT
jgi:PTH2 family peptidyl-tRNA hydrolase